MSGQCSPQTRDPGPFGGGGVLRTSWDGVLVLFWMQSFREMGLKVLYTGRVQNTASVLADAMISPSPNSSLVSRISHNLKHFQLNFRVVQCKSWRRYVSFGWGCFRDPFVKTWMGHIFRCFGSICSEWLDCLRHVTKERGKAGGDGWSYQDPY